MTLPPSSAYRWVDRTHIGDCHYLLRQMIEDGVSVRMCVTSPPYYRLRSYLPAGHPDKALELGAEDSPAAFVTRLVEVFRAVRTLLTDDGTLWIVVGDTYAGTGKSGGGSQGRRWDAHGAEVFGPRGGRWSPPPAGLKQKDLMGIPWMLAFALRDDGWFLRQDIIWSTRNPMPESVTDRCTRSHEYLFLLAKQERYFFDHRAIMEPAVDPRGPGNVRPVRQPPGERDTGANANLRGSLHRIGARNARHKRDVWSIASKPFRGAHFAIFPEELVIPCILAGSHAGDTVLDPFMGSGTTAAVAKRLQRRFIGCELNPSFLELHRLR